MKLIKKAAALLAAMALLFSAAVPAFSVYADGTGTAGTDSPEGDGNVYVSPRYLAGTQPTSLAGKTPLDINVFVKALLEKVGKGYSQDYRYDVNYYDCSSLVQRVFRDLGITANVPASTYYWRELLDEAPVGDTVIFYGTDTYAEYRLTAKNITIQGNESYFTKPGTIIVLIAPELYEGHICVSLGSFARQDEGLDPTADRLTIIQNTEDYVAAQLEERYGVPASLLTEPGTVTGIRSIWMDENALGTDMTTKYGGQSGPYSPIWRVEAFNPSKGVCVDNCTFGTNYTPNVRYVLEPVSSGEQTMPDAPPEITDVTVSDVTSLGYRVTVKYNAPAGIRLVQMPTWTEKNWQDDLQWYNAVIEDAHTAYWDVKISDHNNEKGAYITHVYVTDLLDRQVIAGVNVTVPETDPVNPGEEDPENPGESEKMGFTEAWVSDVTKDGYVVNAEFVAPNGVSEILMPTWTEANGQDDLVWHQASTTDGRTVQYYVKTSDHHGESGLYITHIYVRDPKGNEIVAGVSADVPESVPVKPSKPAITDLEITELTQNGYRVTATISSLTPIKEVLMPTWTEANGQDDLIWHETQAYGLKPGTGLYEASYYVSIGDHHNEHGQYITHVYVTDEAGEQAVAATGTVVPESAPVVQKELRITGIEVTELSEDGFRVTAAFTAPDGVSEVVMPTWTKANGQDDLVWHSAQIIENTATCYIRKAAHNNESGHYITHVYVKDPTGKQVVEAVNTEVPEKSTPVQPEPSTDPDGPVITNITISNVNTGGYSVTALMNVPNGVSRVLMPTWTDKNWQDDLVWHEALVTGNFAYLRVSTEDHNYEAGLYHTHIYVYDENGAYVIKPVDVIVPETEDEPPTVQEELGIKYVVVTGLNIHSFTVFAEFTAPNGISEVLMPTWTEANGQDDLIWYQPEIDSPNAPYKVEGHTATLLVQTADHNDEHGRYITHVYVRDSTGKEIVASINIDVPEPGDSLLPTQPDDSEFPVYYYTQRGIYIYDGLDYAPVFHPDYYLTMYPDLRQAFGTNAQLAFQHFINNGIQEGRVAIPYFSVTVYRDRYEDLRNAFGDDLSLYVKHYLTSGIQEGRSGQ